MQFSLSIIAFASAALAQTAQIGLPTEGQKVTAGSEIIVQVQRPNSLTSSQEMAVAIGITSCGDACQSPSDVLGNVLYNGAFKPVYHESYLAPYQNFSVKIPATFAAGSAQINVAHATLIGAGPEPFLETLNQTIVVV
ncbi:hypothetical protein N7495_004472 [Penicillium taxi]|uniref:uncharacterized protein n=1 Tax=Penicillium taxi TaxID=168475 RepID=UPI00254597B0|nr:uncharacterized protein N7495_004472 [Penicillium taxi]KAJ5899728.1 hypothetical protein N7495_004472 [Penicillium taxi]